MKLPSHYRKNLNRHGGNARLSQLHAEQAEIEQKLRRHREAVRRLRKLGYKVTDDGEIRHEPNTG
jgi:cell wall assembly regulator SMI1